MGCGERGKKGEKAEPSKGAVGAAKAHVLTNSNPSGKPNKLESRLASMQSLSTPSAVSAAPKRRSGFMGHIMVSNHSGNVSKVVEVQKAATSLKGEQAVASSASVGTGLRPSMKG